jgi:hypothetical protein
VKRDRGQSFPGIDGHLDGSHNVAVASLRFLPHGFASPVSDSAGEVHLYQDRKRHSRVRSSRARNHSTTAVRRKRMTRPTATRGGPIPQRMPARQAAQTDAQFAGQLDGVMYSPVMSGAANFAVSVSPRSTCLVFMAREYISWPILSMFPASKK